MNRFWDPNNNYPDAVLKEFEFWSVEVSYAQHTFGNFIVFCKRNGVEKLTDLTDEEMLELKKALKEIQEALEKNPTFKPDRFNYWQMGNAVHHLHIHGIPRYKSNREFLGRTWKDQDHTMPACWKTEKEDRNTIIAVKEEMKKFL
jgi:diadenosine tetraphosphate (Ap4A) HIT family hydrolase